MVGGEGAVRLVIVNAEIGVPSPQFTVPLNVSPVPGSVKLARTATANRLH